MNNITLLAIDLAKSTFQIHGTDKNGKAILKKTISILKGIFILKRRVLH